MQRSFVFCTVSVIALFAGYHRAAAQTTVTATLPAAGPVAAPAMAPPVPVAAPRGFGLVSGLSAKCQACRIRLKNSPLGMMLKGVKGQLSAVTGGLVPPPGAGHPAGAPGGPPPPAVGAAGKIKQEQAAAAVRRDAVKFLATVDCHWYPEAEQALIASLRTDRSECVRWEAALALANGCCCTPRTIEALRIAASGSSRDGNPGERSMRVRLSAFEALQACLCSSQAQWLESAPLDSRPETPDQPLRRSDNGQSIGQLEENVLPAYYRQMASRPASEVIRQARHTINQLRPGAARRPAEQRQGNFYQLWVSAGGDSQPGVPNLAGDTPQHSPATSQPQHQIAPAGFQLRRLPEEQPSPVYITRDPETMRR